MPLNNFLRCIHVASIFPAFIWFYIWFHRGLLKSPPPVPPTLWRQGPRSRCTGPKNRDRAQKQLIWLSKKIPWVQNKFMQVHKKYSHRVQKTHRQVPTFFVTLGPKKFWLGPKNMYRSKKRVPRSKKHASRWLFLYLFIISSWGWFDDGFCMVLPNATGYLSTPNFFAKKPDALLGSSKKYAGWNRSTFWCSTWHQVLIQQIGR